MASPRTRRVLQEIRPKDDNSVRYFTSQLLPVVCFTISFSSLFSCVSNVAFTIHNGHL